ncbi:MAG: tetratricopeptide repeat protein, partial [Hymenobacteraceae bacterium]|nr:tetratricopeptide repeat protein [Hymenobacteraceae bacterium]
EQTRGGAGNGDKLLSPQEREAAEALFIDGVRYLQLDEPTRALEKLVKTWQLDPTNAAVNYKLAETSVRLNQLPEALAYGKAAVRLEPKNRFYYLLLAQLYTGQQHYEDAADVYAALLREVPDSEKYLFPLADLYILTSRFDQALEALDRAEKRFGVVEETALKKQQIYLKRHDLPKAVAEGEALIAANPLEVRYVLGLAAMLANANANANANDIGRAQEQVDRALRLAPDHPQALLLRADLRRRLDDDVSAEADVRRAFRSPDLDIDERVRILVEYLKRLTPVGAAGAEAPGQRQARQTALDLAALTVQTNPLEAKAFAIAGDLQTLADLKTEARASYLSAVKLDNSKFKVWQQLVYLDAELEQTDSLLRHSDRALALFPNQPILYLYNGSALFVKKEYARAARALEYGRKLVADEPEVRWRFDGKLGNTYEALKEYEKSAAAYEASLAVQPDNAEVLNNYAYYLSLRNQQLEKARTMSERLIKLNPTDGTYLDTHAWVLYKLGEYEAARGFLEKALKGQPNPEVLEHYGDVLWRLGRPDDALQQWQRARQLQREPSETLERKIHDKNLYE